MLRKIFPRKAHALADDLQRADPTIAQPLANWRLSSQEAASLRDEWTACRETVGRLDAILYELRKLGFPFITAILTAGQFLGIDHDGERYQFAGSLVAALTIVLISAIFALDMHYQCLLSAAVERALDIEAAPGIPIRLTKYMAANALDIRLTWLPTVAYTVLACAAATTSYIVAGASWPSYSVSGGGAVSILAMWAYRRRCERRCGISTEKSERIWHEGAALGAGGKVTFPLTADGAPVHYGPVELLSDTVSGTVAGPGSEEDGHVLRRPV